MFEVYASTVNLQIRQVVMTTLLKIVYFSDTNVLERVLASIPLAGFIAGVLAQKEHSSLIVSALQLAELLLTKLPLLYADHFETEGVIFEINRLASTSDESTSKAVTAEEPSTSSKAPATAAVEEDTSSATEKLESELEAIFGGGNQEPDASFSSGMRLFDRLKKSSTSYMTGNESGGRDKGLGQKDTRQWIIITCRNFLFTYTDVSKVSDASSHTADIDNLKQVAQCLQGTGSDGMTHKEALGAMATRYKSGSGISSFELMNTGLIDALLTYLTTNETEGTNRINRTFQAFTHLHSTLLLSRRTRSQLSPSYVYAHFHGWTRS
jgi:E3 ubiquitin-protein ligase TRIP12